MSVSEGMVVERVRASEGAVLGQVRAIEVARLETRPSAARLAQAWPGQDSSDFQAPGKHVEWIPVSTGSELMIGSQRFVVTSVMGSAGDLPEGQASDQVVLRSIAS